MAWGYSKPTDEELSKKDDDAILPRTSTHWQPVNSRLRSPSKLRYVLYIGVLVVLVLLIRAVTVSSEDVVRPYSGSSDRYFPDYASHGGGFRKPQQQSPPKVKVDTKVPIEKASGQNEPLHTTKYNGRIKFQALASSLRSIAMTGGRANQNRNVLFAAANLKSVANLLPLACDMAFERENFVHFAFMIRSEMSLKELLAINGFKGDCSIIVHDARPDYSASSTDSRLALAAARAIYHINTYMHPQAIIIDGTNTEDDYFLRGVRDQIRSTPATLIELPEKASTRLSWIRKLDTHALAAWNRVHFDIVIQAPLVGSGNMNRLFRSLRDVDLAGMSAPHITVELPPVVDPGLERILGDFKWPPNAGDVPQSRMLSLRHRIKRARLTEEEKSVRFLESFWPSNPSQHHVLVLSPHTEVTPKFFHYVKYELLYRHFSASGAMQNVENKMLGLGFALPTQLLHEDKQFMLPESATGPFIWEAPNSDAMLIMGDKWQELHGYVSLLLQKQEESAHKLRKRLTIKYPAWLEHLLQLSRLRGYYTVYPGKETANVILGVHSDLVDVPEEYEGQKQDRPRPSEEFSDKALDEGFDPGTQIDMMSTLPHNGDLAALQSMPIIMWDGQPTTMETLQKAAGAYTEDFRLEVGGCPKDMQAVVPDHKHATDLFCAA